MPPKRAAAKPKASKAKAAAAKPKTSNGAGAGAEKKTRNLMTDRLGLSISTARSDSHMRHQFTPPDVEKELAAKRAEIKELKEVAEAEDRDPAEDEDLLQAKAELAELNKSVVRISNDAPIAVAALCDVIATSLIRWAMDQTILAGGKMVEIKALHDGDLTTSAVWPLVGDLDAIKSYDPEYEEQLRKEQTAANKRQKEMRAAAKAAREAGEEVPAPAEQDDGDDKDKDGLSTNFNTYIDNAQKAVKKEDDEAYGLMRVTGRLRQVISDVIAEFIARLSQVAKILVLELLGVRTLSAEQILVMVKTDYVRKTGEPENESMVEICTYVQGKLALFEKHLADEAARKAASLTPEQKAEIQQKKEAAAAAKRKRDAATAKQRAIEMAQKAKNLAAEV